MINSFKVGGRAPFDGNYAAKEGRYRVVLVLGSSAGVIPSVLHHPSIEKAEEEARRVFRGNKVSSVILDDRGIIRATVPPLEDAA